MRFKKSLSSLFFLSGFFILLFCYSRLSPKIPVSYWDEFYWVGQSYLFQHFIQGDFKQKVWNTRNSYDHATLAKFAFGAWLYPKYISEKNLARIDTNDSGFLDFYKRRYGNKVLKTINLIYEARKMNFIFLAAAILVLCLFFQKQKGALFSFLFFLFYGFNSLIIRNGLKAHSDGLFLLLFNLSLVLLFKYFLKKRKLRYLILFSIFTGLTMATKINGIMLYVVFIAIYLTEFSQSFWGPRLSRGTPESLFDSGRVPPLAGLARMTLINILLPLLIILSIFILLNPYTYPNPPQKILKMFTYRYSIASYEAQTVFTNQHLSSPASRIAQTFINFFSPKSIADYNLLFNMRPKILYGIFLLALFILGLIDEIKKIIKGEKLPYLILSSFIYILIIMSFYLHINWDRYFIQLVFFFIYYQICGIALILNLIIKPLSSRGAKRRSDPITVQRLLRSKNHRSQ